MKLRTTRTRNRNDLRAPGASWQTPVRGLTTRPGTDTDHQIRQSLQARNDHDANHEAAAEGYQTRMVLPRPDYRTQCRGIKSDAQMGREARTQIIYRKCKSYCGTPAEETDVTPEQLATNNVTFTTDALDLFRAGNSPLAPRTRKCLGPFSTN